MYQKINDFLDRYVLPLPVRFLTFRFVILATMALLIPLLVYANNTVLVLGINSYLNTMSVAVSSIVLLYTTIAEANQKKIALMQEKRAREDHAHVTEMNKVMHQMLTRQSEEIETLKAMLCQMQGVPYERGEKTTPPDLHALHPRGASRFEAQEGEDRLHDQTTHFITLDEG
ncbi:MAG: hypothetical protein HPY76_00315 [Anaerolineae bacterium]|nr:hypothetical protein [Anaerolineae bacterium]